LTAAKCSERGDSCADYQLLQETCSDQTKEGELVVLAIVATMVVHRWGGRRANIGAGCGSIEEGGGRGIDIGFREKILRGKGGFTDRLNWQHLRREGREGVAFKSPQRKKREGGAYPH